MRGFEHVKEEAREYEKKGVIPERGTKHSAGYDFYTPIDFSLEPGESRLVFTNIKAYMQDWEYLQVTIRSSLALKQDLMLANTPAVIDCDYYENPDNDGNIGLIVKNNSNSDIVHIEADSRIAQGIFLEYKVVDGDNTCLNKINGNNKNNNEREGGFGSTGE